MQDSETYESYPTHPLGARDSWPETGPVYGIPDREVAPVQSKTIWQRFVANVQNAPDDMATAPANSPIWY